MGVSFKHDSTIDWNRVVELSFRSIVEDYFYVGAEGRLYKTDRLAKWKSDVKSFIPENTVLGIKRKLHRAKVVYDLKDFNNIDEAVRFAIDYVIEYGRTDLNARIAVSGGLLNLPTALVVKVPGVEVESDLTSVITGVQKTMVVGLDDDGIEIL
jgi:hypothetical protein